MRRRRAKRRAGQADVLRSVLFICYGNVCRSPYAEAACRQGLEKLDQTGDHVASAGFVGPHRSPPKVAIEAARARGIDLAGHVSRVVTSEMAERAGIVMVMSEKQRKSILALLGSEAKTEVLILGDFDPAPITSREIHDPWGASPEVFDRVYARIDRCLEAWMASWTRRVPDA